MANPYQQLAQRRKLIYALLIVSLFTLSLLHRRMFIEPQAFGLQLRESARGEVELTSSAVRLTLTGSRGLATTVLWAAAIGKQKKHEWNELELLVNSITKLQPYFLTPWRFQGWNLAFNVSVECDRPLDKYYYISRGLTLLSQGERRNQGAEIEPGKPIFPGSPDLRRDIGFYYQLKMGTADEKNTMRCLLDMGCIDPVRRKKVEDVLAKKAIGQEKELREQVNSLALEYPMFVRRLIDHVDCDSDRRVAQFLVDNRDVPSRFKPIADPNQQQAALKDATEQFPILPRHESADWPDPDAYKLTDEKITIYLMSRTWFQFAQKPLPPANRDPSAPFERGPYRLPLMSPQIFRSDPCRAQAFIAETREEEGWFDEDGWSPPWYDKETAKDGKDLLANGIDYMAGPLWNKAYRMYKDYGVDNGLYLAPAYKAELEDLAKKFRAVHKIAPDRSAREIPSAEKDPGYRAHELLRAHDEYRRLTNYDAHLFTTDAERDPETVLARKIFFKAEQARTSQTRQAEALQLYDQGNFIWMEVLLRYPAFAKISTNQEDTYEIELDQMRLAQRENPSFFRDVAMGMAQFAVQWPYVPIPWGESWTYTDPKTQQTSTRKFLSDAERINVAKIKTVRGPFTTTRYYNTPQAPEVKDALFLWSSGASLYPLAIYPNQQVWLLTKRTLGEQAPPPNWSYFVDDSAVGSVRSRRSLPSLK